MADTERPAPEMTPDGKGFNVVARVDCLDVNAAFES